MKLALKRFFVFVSLAIISTRVVASHNNNFSELHKDISANPTIHVGMSVIDPDTGASVYQYQAEQYFDPASNVKLFTAIAAMLSLGADYHFNTILYSNPKIKAGTLNGDVYIKFSGDPSLTEADLKGLLAHLQQQGVRSINGNLVLDTTIFPTDLSPLGLVREDSMWAFGAPATSITLHENSLQVTFKKDTQTPEITQVQPSFFKVTSNLIFESEQNQQLCSFAAEAIDAQHILLHGCIPPRLLPTIGLAMPDPNAYAKFLINQDLAALGIHLKGHIIFGTVPKNTPPMLAQHASAPLSELLTWMLQTSDNLYASAITKTLGLKTFGVANNKVGSVAIMNILAPYHLPDYHLEDGAGISNYNLVTPTVMTQLLYQANKNPTLANFLLEALPEMDVNGTLDDFPAAALKGKVLAKTGSLVNVSSLSGFIETKRGKTLIFSILIDDAPLPHHDLKVFEAKVLMDLYNNY